MEMFYFLGVCVMLFARSADALAAITVPPADSTAACPTMGSVAEGTKTGTLVTVAATGNGPLTFAMRGPDAAMFEVSEAGVISIKAAAVLDFETKVSYSVEVIVTDDDDASTMTGTCTLAVIDVALSVIGYAKQIIVPEAAAEDDAIMTLKCTDGADAAAYTYAIADGDDSGSPKFAISAAGAITKTATPFDAATKDQYILTLTCEDATKTTATVTICVETDCTSKASFTKGILAGLIVPTLLAIYQVL